MGKIYVKVVVDVFCSFAVAKVYNNRMPITACDLLYERVLPFYDARGAKVGAVLTDNGRGEVWQAKASSHVLMLALEDIERRTTKVLSSRTNGIAEA